MFNVDNRWKIKYMINEPIKPVAEMMKRKFEEKYRVNIEDDGAISFESNVVFHKEIDRKIKRAVDYIRETHDNAERVVHGIRR